MPEQLRLIKKYPNRRLYDTKTSAYITLSDVKDLVLLKENFNVLDAKTGEDITRSILLQIILEEEAAGIPLFTTDLLAQMIRFYGHAMQGMLGKYLETNIKSIWKRTSSPSSIFRRSCRTSHNSSMVKTAARCRTTCGRSS